LQEQNYQVIGQVESVENAYEVLERTHVDVILADSSGDGVLDTDWIQHVVLHATGIIILVTASNSEMDFVREAMLAGAQSFLLKPFDLSDLSRSIEQVHRLWLQRQANLTEVAGGTPAAPTHKAHSIAVFSPKGGTGVTALAVNLAVALKQQTGAPVLLVDADLRNADVDIFLNIFSKYSLLDVIHLDQKVNNELLRSVVTEHATGIAVLRGDARLQFVDTPLNPGEMGNLIEELNACWDGHIVINTSNSMDRWTIEILDNVDHVVLVATPELPALRAMRSFLDLAEADADLTGKWQLVMSSYQSQKILRMTDIEASIRYPIKATISEDSALVSASINRGKPLVFSHDKSIIAKDIIALAKQLAENGANASKSSSGSKQPGTPPEMAAYAPQSGKRPSFWHSLTNSVRLPIG
jgi:pilus assembly protein CpaE